MRLLAYDCSRFVLASSVILSPVMSSKYCRLSVPFRFSPCSNRVDVRGDIFFCSWLVVWSSVLLSFIVCVACACFHLVLCVACCYECVFVPVVVRSGCLLVLFFSCHVMFFVSRCLLVPVLVRVSCVISFF